MRQSFEYTSDSIQAERRLLQGPWLSSCSRGKHESNILEGRTSQSTHPGGPWGLRPLRRADTQQLTLEYVSKREERRGPPPPPSPPEAEGEISGG